jgi:hypothetical protein
MSGKEWGQGCKIAIQETAFTDKPESLLEESAIGTVLQTWVFSL